MKKLFLFILLLPLTVFAEFQYQDTVVYQSNIFAKDDMVTGNIYADEYSLGMNDVSKALKYANKAGVNGCDYKFMALDSAAKGASEVNNVGGVNRIIDEMNKIYTTCDKLVKTKKQSTFKVSNMVYTPGTEIVWQKYKLTEDKIIDTILEAITMDLQEGAQLDKNYFKSLLTNELPCEAKVRIVNTLKLFSNKLINEGGPNFLQAVEEASNEIGCK